MLKKGNDASFFYSQKKEHLNKSWIIVDDYSKPIVIERDCAILLVFVTDLQEGDILLDTLTQSVVDEADSIIELFNLSVQCHEKTYVKIGKVTSSKIEQIDMYDKKVHVTYENYLAELLIDINLVQKQCESWSLKDMYYSVEIESGNNTVINQAVQKGGELDKIINKTILNNQLEPNESYEVIKLITADGEGLNNKILYLKDKSGLIKSYGIGNLINEVSYNTGDIILLEDVLRNSVSLIEEACIQIDGSFEAFVIH